LRAVEEGQELQVVTTEIGSPTYAPDLADALAKLIRHPLYGFYHLTNAGVCSRYEFTKKILEYAGKADYPIRPVDEFPRPAKRPPRVELKNFCAATQLGIVLRSWEEALRDYFSS
jgi:dTDP-4-dehydrorhamnose reductase